MFKDNAALLKAINQTPLAKKYKISLSKVSYYGVTVMKSGAAKVQIHASSKTCLGVSFFLRSNRGGYPMAKQRYFYSPRETYNSVLREVTKFLKDAPKVKVTEKSAKSKKHAKNRLKLLRSYGARSPVIFKVHECIDAKIYLYGDRALEDPENNLTIKADLWIATKDIAYASIKNKWGHKPIDYWQRCVIDIDDKGTITRVYSIDPETQKGRTLTIANPKFIEEAISEAICEE